MRLQTFEVEVRPAGTGPWVPLGVIPVNKLEREFSRIRLHTTDRDDLVSWANEDYEAGVSRWLYPGYGPRPQGHEDATP